MSPCSPLGCGNTPDLHTLKTLDGLPLFPFSPSRYCSRVLYLCNLASGPPLSLLSLYQQRSFSPVFLILADFFFSPTYSHVGQPSLVVFVPDSPPYLNACSWAGPPPHVVQSIFVHTFCRLPHYAESFSFFLSFCCSRCGFVFGLSAVLRR